MALQQTTQIPEIREAIVVLRHMSADEKIRQEAEYREKLLHDEASALTGARMEGRTEGLAEGKAEERQAIADRMRAQGFTEEQINAVIGE